MNPYLIKINSFINQLDKDSLSALKDISTSKMYRKGELILRQGEVCRHSFTIEKGILRKFYLYDVKEITTEFYFKDDIAIAFDSYCQQKPSKEFIEAITDTTLLQISFAEFQTAKVNFPKLVELDLLLVEYYAVWLESRLFEISTLDATKRYLRLLNEQTHIIHNIPLTYIASYLNISLETLSRIRAKI